MSSNTFEASHTTSTETSSKPSNSRVDSPASTALTSDDTMLTRTVLSIMPTGGSSSNLVLMPSETRSSPTHETPLGTPSSSLKSHAKPQEIQESLPVEPRILRVSKEDIESLCQVVAEFKEQCAF